MDQVTILPFVDFQVSWWLPAEGGDKLTSSMTPSRCLTMSSKALS